MGGKEEGGRTNERVYPSARSIPHQPGGKRAGGAELVDGGSWVGGGGVLLGAVDRGRRGV